MYSIYVCTVYIYVCVCKYKHTVNMYIQKERERVSESSSLEMSASVEWLLIFLCCILSADGGWYCWTWLLGEALTSHRRRSAGHSCFLLLNQKKKTKKKTPSLVIELIAALCISIYHELSPLSARVAMHHHVVIYFLAIPSKNMAARMIKQTRESFASFFALRCSSVLCEVSSSSFLNHFTANTQKIQHVVGLTVSLITLGGIVSWILFFPVPVYAYACPLQWVICTVYNIVTAVCPAVVLVSVQNSSVDGRWIIFTS